MHIFADYHMHSTYSDGRATIAEMAEAARKKRLEKITIADHGPNNIGVGVKKAETYLTIKEEIKELNKNLSDLQVLAGAEANIVDLSGGIDIPASICKELDMLLVGLHPYVWPNNLQTAWDYVLMNQLQKHIGAAKEKLITNNTKTLVEALYKHDVDIVTHPGLGMPLDIEEVAKACVVTKTAFEINVGHAYQNLADIVQVARLGAQFVVNSDAHFTQSVGQLDKGIALLEQAKIPVEQIINAREN